MRGIIALALASTLLGGCIFVAHTGPRHGRDRNGCGPAYHWDDGHCVHNGHGNGKSGKSNHERAKGRDHR
jgi:hypothetical protein